MAGSTQQMQLQNITDILAAQPALELGILVGSRTNGTAGPGSDWDIALQWSRDLGFMEQLAATEQLRNSLTELLGVGECTIDLIDIPSARLTMRAVIAEEGIALKGAESLAWHRFLQRTWRELEEIYWEQIYAA